MLCAKFTSQPDLCGTLAESKTALKQSPLKQITLADHIKANHIKAESH